MEQSTDFGAGLPGFKFYLRNILACAGLDKLIYPVYASVYSSINGE